MKNKIAFLLMVLFILSGCSIGGGDKNNKADNRAQVDNISNATTTEVANNKNNNEENKNMPQPGIDPYKFEDLVTKYNQAVIKTNKGNIRVEFYKESPFTVNNFLNLAKTGYYNGTTFHRIIKDFMIQGGDINSKDSDPTNDGKGGPGYYFKDEFNSHQLVLGSLAMANAGPNTNGSQFFIVTATSTPWLDGKHTNFGQVIEGLDIVQSIATVAVDTNDRPTENITVNSIELIPSPVSEIPPANAAATATTTTQVDGTGTTTETKTIETATTTPVK